MRSPWQDLEIEPTSDVVAIRRAYSARLRRTRPEDAARIRAAYEGAIAALPLTPEPSSTPIDAPGPIGDALASADPVAAAKLVAAGRIDGSLSLRQDIDAVERLISRLVTDRTVSLDSMEQVAEALGWFESKRELPAGAAFARLRARLSAERWWASLVEIASRRRPFDREAAAARQLLGQIQHNLLERITVSRAALVQLLAEFDRHREWVEYRFDQAALTEARRIAGTPE